jgi:hypothetical protein
MVLRQRTEIRLDDPFSQIFSQFCMAAHDFVTNTVVLTKARADLVLKAYMKDTGDSHKRIKYHELLQEV